LVMNFMLQTVMVVVSPFFVDSIIMSTHISLSDALFSFFFFQQFPQNQLFSTNASKIKNSTNKITK
jgi:hypothetical protein